MNNYLRKVLFTSIFAAFALLFISAAVNLKDISLIPTAHAKESNDSGHGSSGQKGKGPKYKGGRGAEGHGGSDSAHKGSSSHGGGSKTLEDTVFHSDGGHVTGSDGGHKGGSTSMGGKKFMGGGKGGHEEDEEGHGESEGGDTQGHAE